MSLIRKEENLDELLSSITESIDSTALILDKLENDFNLNKKGENYPELIKNLINTLDSDFNNQLDSVSLLSLKNASLLGYVTDLALLLATKLETIKNQKHKTSIIKGRTSLLNSLVTDRVVLEKGVKSLEKKISYQLEKMTNAYHRREKEQEDLKNKINEQEKEQAEISENEESEESEDEKEEGLNFKPNPSALLSRGKVNHSLRNNEADEVEKEEGEEEKNKEKSNEKYKPPKISAAAINDPDKEIKHRKQKNLQSMDEYLQDISEAPSIEQSIGSTIINKGRDVKSKRQMEKEAEIQRYEEENFTRLPATKTKENKKERAKRMRNEFFGEDWSMFDNNLNMNGNNDSNSKKRKRISAWERAKRKID